MKAAKIKPLISYYGGKQRLASKIVPMIPPHTVYCEPFAGGAAVFFRKPVPSLTNSDHYREAINDISGELIHLYLTAQRFPQDFASVVKTLPLSHSIFKWSNPNIDDDSLTKAVKTYVRLQQSFGNIGSSWRRATFGRNDASTWQRSISHNLRSSLARLRDVYLDSVDFSTFMSLWDSPQSFFYIDPPYLGTHLAGMGQWSDDDQNRLCQTIDSLQGSYILSTYRTSALPGHEVLLQIDANCTVTGAGKTGKTRNHGEPIKGIGRERKELLLMRGPRSAVRSSLQDVLVRQQIFTGPLLGPCPLPSSCAVKRKAQTA